MFKPTRGTDASDRIERLKRKLYSRVNPAVYTDERSDIGPGELNVKQNWADSEEALPTVSEKKSFSFTSKLFIGSVLFFLVSLGVAAAIFFGGLNIVSPKNVDISIVGPVSTAGGEELSLDVVVQNNNSVDLENVVLTVTFPEGSRVAGNLAQPLVIEKQDIGTIKAGETAHRTVKGVLFGEKDSVQEIKVGAEYKIRTSNAEFQKEKTYEIAIKSSPLIMTIDYPKEVNVNQEIEFKVSIASNTNSPLQNIAVRAEYPFGFVFKDSQPGAFADNNVWHLGDLKPLEKREIVVRGYIEAQNNEERTFRFYAGNISPDDDRMIGVNLTDSVLSVTMKKPQLALGTEVASGNSSEFVASAGQGFSVGILWKNNLPVNLENAQIEARLSGSILNKDEVTPGSNGYYRSADDIVTWDKFVTPELSQIAPGEGGRVSVTVAPMRTTPELIAAIRNPEITLDITMEGNRLEGGLPQKISSTLTRKVKVGTELGFNARLVHSTGPFANTGPIPPKADTETTYTVVWSLTNTFNDVSGGRVTASLPPYVKWMGVSSPSAERISFNPLTQEVVWDVGELKRGAGYTTSPREVYFKVAVTPSLSHVGTSPVVVNTASVSARDNFTGKVLELREPELNTQLSTDPNFDQRSGSVVK